MVSPLKYPAATYFRLQWQQWTLWYGFGWTFTISVGQKRTISSWGNQSNEWVLPLFYMCWLRKYTYIGSVQSTDLCQSNQSYRGSTRPMPHEFMKGCIPLRYCLYRKSCPHVIYFASGDCQLLVRHIIILPSFRIQSLHTGGCSCKAFLCLSNDVSLPLVLITSLLFLCTFSPNLRRESSPTQPRLRSKAAVLGRAWCR